MPHVAVINVRTSSQQACGQVAVKHAATQIAIVPNFTNGRPVIRFAAIVD